MLATNPFDLQAPLGAGASSTVYACKSGEIETVLKLGRRGTARTLANEANCLAMTESLFLPKLISAGTLEQALRDGSGREFEVGTPYLLVSRLPGNSPGVGRASESNARQASVAETVLRDASGALRDLHAVGFAHGDIKPANTLVAGGAKRAFVIDLGLACPIDTHQIQGATPAYLPPESTGTGSSAQSRDLWALGRTVLTILDPSVCHLTANQLVDSNNQAALSKLPPDLQRLVRGLLSESPAHRPRAEWLYAQLSGSPSVADRQSRVRRAYVSVRKHELAPLLRGATYTLGTSGLPAKWLEDTCSRLVQVRKMNGVAANDAVVELAEFSTLDKRRWLLRLAGAHASSGDSLLGHADPELAKILWQSCERGEPSLVALVDKEHSVPLRRSTEDQQILELGSGCPQESTLRSLESRHLETPWPIDIALELSRVLLRRNEFARCRVILDTLLGDRVALESAYLLIRTGSSAEAQESLTELAQSQNADVASEAGALLARLSLDSGNKRQAKQWLAHAKITPRSLESSVSLSLTNAQLGEAERLLALALSLPLVPAQRARFHGLQANLASQRSETELALSHYRSAAEQAQRAGAILDEASYMTGVAQAASSLGHVRTAIGAAERALLLFEYIERRDSAARVKLVLASTFALAGATDEARTNAEHCFRQATRSGDKRCAFYAQLVLVDTVTSKDLSDHLERAAHQLTQIESPTGGDQLHLAARQWNSGAGISSTDFDLMARQDHHEIGARLTWWASRASRFILERELGPSSAVRSNRDLTPSILADETLILTQLATCTAAKSALEARAPALAAGAQLAALAGDASLARRFTEQARQCLTTLTEHTPVSLKPALEGLTWTKNLLTSEPSLLTTEQIADVVSLIRNLGDRGRLRPLLERVLDAMILWTGVERGLLLLRAPQGRLVPRAARNIARHNLSGAQLELSTTLAKRAAETRECVVAVDAVGELPDLHQSVHALKLRSVLAVPLIAHGEVIGVVYLDDRVRRGAFGPQELAWVRLAATVTSVAIADTRAQLELRRALRKTQRAEARAARALAARSAELALAQQQLTLPESDSAFSEIIGASGALQPLFQSLHRVAAAEVPVLILGESGTGKELVAKAIHRNSPRRDGKFVTENCSAIPEALMESTLFGHVRGAFTGASHDRIGLFELASQGTLFLDEIADMPPSLQVKLLRVLEDGIVRPVGSERVRKVDVRVLAATHKDLSQLVEQGQFRSDLLYRLNVFELKLPPLRERTEDIPALIRHFLQKHASEGNAPTLTEAALTHLLNADWPGNVRQLENEIRRALVLCDGSIGLEHISRKGADRQPHAVTDGSPEDSLDLRSHVNSLERKLIERALAQTSGNQTRAARLLGLSRYGLQKKMHRLFTAIPD